MKRLGIIVIIVFAVLGLQMMAASSNEWVTRYRNVEFAAPGEIDISSRPDLRALIDSVISSTMRYKGKEFPCIIYISVGSYDEQRKAKHDNTYKIQDSTTLYVAISIDPLFRIKHKDLLCGYIYSNNMIVGVSDNEPNFPIIEGSDKKTIQYRVGDSMDLDLHICGYDLYKDGTYTQVLLIAG